MKRRRAYFRSDGEPKPWMYTRERAAEFHDEEVDPTASESENSSASERRGHGEESAGWFPSWPVKQLPPCRLCLMDRCSRLSVAVPRSLARSLSLYFSFFLLVSTRERCIVRENREWWKEAGGEKEREKKKERKESEQRKFADLNFAWSLTLISRRTVISYN